MADDVRKQDEFCPEVSLDDTSVTEWRSEMVLLNPAICSVSLDDTSVTEWRLKLVFLPRLVRRFTR